jgi:hypothetical protein
MSTVSIEVPINDENGMKEFQNFMDAVMDCHNKEILEMSSKFNISEGCANDIFYLRTRSRWTQEKENYLIWLDQNNKKSPNIMDDFDVPENYDSSQ